MSEHIRCVCRKFNITVVFKCGWTLSSILIKVKNTSWYAIQCDYSLQLQLGLHQGDQMETGDKTEGKPRCLREGNDGEVCCRLCVGEHNTNPLGGDHSAGPWHRTGAVGEGAPALQMTSSEKRFNGEGGLEVLGCWTAVMRS